MITAELVGADRVIAFLERMPEKVQQVLKEDVSRLALALLTKVKEDKLSGQVLKNQTGTLRRSINQKVTVIPNRSVKGSVGTNVIYAKAHEFGVDQFKIITVRAYLRKCKSRSTFTMKTGRFFSLEGATSKLKVASDGIAFVKSFQRNQHTKLPERSFLRSALREMGSEITADLTAAVQRAIR